MENGAAFIYHYSARVNQEVLDIRKKYKTYLNNRRNNTMNKNDQEFLVQKIRTQYTEKEHTQLDALKELDNKVKKPANVFAYIFGAISAIIMGAGMSLVMTDIGAMIGMESTIVPGIVIGVVGLALAIINYPIHKRILNSRKKKYAADIIKLSDELMQGSN